ncbi:hypothetical protein Mcup_1131 [Metallosphaera cuprina Ar-4]|uniref:Uncharacterized protein n=1 Tax=Metallosphaera cuprina (strain Ar-4) TaxID=1006006 RepID=F4G338_METCR|nr:hypothetical protein Mcup_1131 [Metallosphaera cuprina Ar-4]
MLFPFLSLIQKLTYLLAQDEKKISLSEVRANSIEAKFTCGKKDCLKEG